MPNKFVFVVMDNHQAKIWNQGVEAGSPHITVKSGAPVQEHDARAGEPASGEAIGTYLAEISNHLTGASAILLMSPGKGKASGAIHLRDFLTKKHPNLAKSIYEIESVDLTHTSDNELLAHARTEWSKYKQSH